MRQFLKSAAIAIVTAGATLGATNGQLIGMEFHSFAKCRMHLSVVVFSRRDEKLRFFNVVEAATEPFDEPALRKQVAHLFRGLLTLYDSWKQKDIVIEEP